jgi:hypothetical protein
MAGTGTRCWSCGGEAIGSLPGILGGNPPVWTGNRPARSSRPTGLPGLGDRPVAGWPPPHRWSRCPVLAARRSTSSRRLAGDRRRVAPAPPGQRGLAATPGVCLHRRSPDGEPRRRRGPDRHACRRCCCLPPAWAQLKDIPEAVCTGTPVRQTSASPMRASVYSTGMKPV